MKNKYGKNTSNKVTFSKILLYFILFASAVFLFVFEHPNFVFKEGLGFLAWFSYIPVLFLIKKSELKHVWFYGFFYGFFCYALFGYWLGKYSTPGYLFLIFGYGFVLSIVFVVLKLVQILFSKNYWIIQWLVVCSYEFLKTLGFAGFHYGVTGYSQWKYTNLIQICNVTGIFGFSAFVIFPSFFIFSFLQKTFEKKYLMYEIENNEQLFESSTHIKTITDTEQKIHNCSRLSTVISAIVWACMFVFVLIYGINTKKDYSDSSKVKVLAVQSNDNPHENGVEAYAKSLVNLIRITDQAIEINKDIDVVVWPETAIVPAIVYQYEAKKDPARYKIVSYLLDYINEKEQTFVIGNGHTVVQSEIGKRDDYNSALVFEPKKNVIPPRPELYAKMHLVPFSETFPYEKQFPTLYKFIIERGNHLWTPGTEYTVFNSKNLSFSVPICYEDTFTKNCRMMYKNGARCFINLSNDAWCSSIVCQNQHLEMALFRAVENNVPMVRSTASGQTCSISADGKIVKMANPFCTTYIIDEIPVVPKDRAPTIYCRTGDVCGIIFVILAGVLLLSKIIIVIIKKIQK